MVITSQTEAPGAFRQVVRIDAHTLHADIPVGEGGGATAPGPHEYFDASLATCKALTALWYAKRQGIALERVETSVERDDSQERHGTYKLKVHLEFFGALTDAEKQKLHDVVGRCPIHKLMTTTTIEIETDPFVPTP